MAWLAQPAPWQTLVPYNASPFAKLDMGGRNSRQAQWQAARFPLSKPAAPRIKEPVQTDVMYRAPSAKNTLGKPYMPRTGRHG